jgi:hypothetical protein
MALNFKSGFTGTATINGTEVPLKDWTVDPAIRVAETENSLSGGFVLADFSGGKRCTFSFLIDFDYDANPYGAPLALRINQTIVQVKLFLNGTAGIFWLFPSALVVGTPQGHRAHERGDGQRSHQLHGHRHVQLSGRRRALIDVQPERQRFPCPNCPNSPAPATRPRCPATRSRRRGCANLARPNRNSRGRIIADVTAGAKDSDPETRKVSC